MNQEILINKDLDYKSCLKRLDKTGTGVLFVIDSDEKLLGAISDGDLRRFLLSDGKLSDPIEKCYNNSPVYIREDQKDIQLIKDIFLKKRIEVLPVVDSNMKIIEIISWETFFSGQNRTRDYKPLDIPVIIMAGGKGTRMEPFTSVLPKPLIPVGNQTMLEYIIGEYKNYQIRDYFLTINYKGNLIKAYFEGIEKDYNINYLVETEFLGTAGSLKLLEKVPDTFIVSNCDIIVKADYNDVLDFHKKSGAVLTIISSIQHHTIPYGVIDFTNGGYVTKIVEKPEYSMPINTGVYILEKEAWDYIPEGKFFHMTHLIEELIKDGKKVMTYPVNESDYIDIGQWKEYRNAIEKLI